MSEPKKRGPKPKCKECGRKEGEGHYDDCPVGRGVALHVSAGVTPPSPEMNAAIAKKTEELRSEVDAVSAAQAYAMRVWEGQSITAPRPWRIERVKAALEGQGLSFDGVVLPDGDFFADLDREREENRK